MTNKSIDKGSNQRKAENKEFRPKRAFKEKKDSKCKYIGKCESCSYIEKTNEEQLKIKQKKVQVLLESFVKVEPIIGMENPYNYRNKVHVAFERTRHGEIVAGNYQEKTHHVVNVDYCNLNHELADKIIITIKELIPSFKIKTYDEETGYGLLRNVLVRRGHKSGEVLVVLVTGYPTFPSKKNFTRELMRKHPEITSVVQSINNKRMNMILGERENVLYGKGYIVDEFCGLTFKIFPKSLYQVNYIQTEVLYNKAIEYANLNGTEAIIDAYCGNGTLGMMAAKNVNKVISIDPNREAVREAITNCNNNQIKNLRVYNADASDLLNSISENDEKIDVVFMEPTRAGSTDQFMDAVVRLAPDKVIYISCSSESLAKDLAYLTKKGYQVKNIQPVDMFPFTTHVETVVLLSQRKADNHIEVDLDLDGLDVTSAESKATYNEIQQYVLKETGLMVSNLYIAQIKKKCGIDVGESFNKPKTENAKQPKCPEDKEKAIKDALKHFGMI